MIAVQDHIDTIEEAAVPMPTPDMSGEQLFKLGMMYSTGQGGAPMDLVSAHMLFNLASMRGSLEATVYRRELSQEMEREDVAEAQRAARRWLDQGTSALRA
jgi:TPR repeat protein